MIKIQQNDIDTKSPPTTQSVTAETLPTLLAQVLKNNDINLLSYLVKCQTNENYLPIYKEFMFQCCEMGKSEMLRLLFQENLLDINTQNSYGETPLHILASKGDIDSLKTILTFNPDKKIKTKEGIIPYDYAIEQGNQDIINMLIVPNDNSKMNLNLMSNEIEGNKRYCHTDRNNKEEYEIEENCNYNCSENNERKVISVIVKSEEDEMKSEGDEHISKEEEYVKEIRDETSEIKPKKFDDLFEFDTETNKDEYYEQIKFFTNHNEVDQLKSSKEEAEVKGIFNNQLTISSSLNAHPNNLNTSSKYINKEKTYNNIHSKINSDVIESKDHNMITSNNKINMLPTSFIFSPSKTKANSYLARNNESNITINNTNNLIFPKTSQTSRQIPKSSLDYYNTNFSESNSLIFSFLKELDLQSYTHSLVENGFNDISLMIEQTKHAIAISDKNLFDIGVVNPGDRAKILVRLEERAKLFPFSIDKEKVYMKTNRNQNALYRMLSSIKLEFYLDNFINTGYISSDLMYLQMLTRQPITEAILTEIGIDKIGFRMRLLNKLRTEAQNYANKANRTSVVFETRKNENEEFCNLCKIF